VAWTLCRAELLCVARRLASAFASSPFVVGAGVLFVAALPALALWSGVRAAAELRVAAADPSFTPAIGLVAALAGAIVTLLAPGRRALGRQLEAAPLSPLTVFLGSTALPLGLLAGGMALPVALFVAPVAGAGTPLVILQLAGAAALGGAGTEAVLALARRSLRGAPVIACAGVLAVVGRDAVPLALVLWLVAAASRPDEPPEHGGVQLVARSAFGCSVARYARRRELRRQALATLALTAASAIALRVVGTPRASGLLLAGSSALLGAAVVPLAAPGLDLRARWLFCSAPASRVAVAARNASAALVAGASVSTVGLGLALAVEPDSPRVLAPLGAGALLVLGSASLAGALVPWRSERLIEQLGAYAAFAVLLVAGWAALARFAAVAGAERGVAAFGLVAAAFACCVVGSVAICARRA
jgi:hypothetical protein